MLVLKYGNLKFLETSGPVQACNGITLTFNKGGLKVCNLWQGTLCHFLYSKATVNMNQPQEIKMAAGSLSRIDLTGCDDIFVLLV